MYLTWNLQEHLECTQSVIGGQVAGTFNQSLQCTQDVFIGFQAPSPPVSPVPQLRRNRFVRQPLAQTDGTHELRGAEDSQ